MRIQLRNAERRGKFAGAHLVDQVIMPGDLFDVSEGPP